MHSLYTTYTDCQTTCQHAAHIVAGKKNLSCVRKERNTFLSHIVTGNEPWCHYHIPTSKQFSFDMEAQKFATRNENKVKNIGQKNYVDAFFDISGPVLVECMPKGITINDAARYTNTLMKLHTNIKIIERRIKRRNHAITQ